MNRLILLILLMGLSNLISAQTRPAATTTSPAVVSVVESVTGKQFQPDTAYAALTKEDETLLAKEPTANWSLPQTSGPMMYYNLVIGTRSYQLIVLQTSKKGAPLATLLRFTDPKAKPEPIARGTLSPKGEKRTE